MTQNNGYYTVPGHSIKITDFGTNQKSICDFILVIRLIRINFGVIHERFLSRDKIVYDNIARQKSLVYGW